MVDSPVTLRNLLRRLADWQAPDATIISAYLDLRPHAGGDNPNVRAGMTVLRDRLRQIERNFQEHTPAHETFAKDVERINALIDDRMPGVSGLAVFAAGGLGLEAAETRIPLNDEVEIAPHPMLVPLARLADAEQAVIALADTSTLRLFVHRSGALEETGLVDDDNDDYSKTEKGGWSQARYQRHVQEHREAFAKLAVEAIDELVGQEEARVLILAGDEVALPLIRDELPKPLAALDRGTLRLEMRATLKEVEAEVLPMLAAFRAQDAEDAADRLVGAALGDAMAVGGARATRNALMLGQALELVLDPAEVDGGDADPEELVRLAAGTDARIRFATDHEGLRRFGGVGALLRFRLDRPIDDPNVDVHALAGKATL